jgi:CubicO group peptidase (beta-lactamase class C family)
MIKPPGEATQSLSELSEILTLTLLNPHIEPELPNRRDWRAAELASMNGAGNALGLARLFAALSTEGEYLGRQILRPDTLREATRARVKGLDINIGIEVTWSAGFYGNNLFNWYGPSPRAFGHSGWGGSFVFADPDNQLSVAYAPNQMDANLHGDPRGMAIVEAVYASLADAG